MWYICKKKRRKKEEKNTKTGQNYIVTTITACATVQNEGPASPMEWYFVVSVILVPLPPDWYSPPIQ